MTLTAEEVLMISGQAKNEEDASRMVAKSVGLVPKLSNPYEELETPQLYNAPNLTEDTRASHAADALAQMAAQLAEVRENISNSKSIQC